MRKFQRSQISEAAAMMGRKGGRIGGKRSLETMTPEQRRERARKAGLASAKARAKQANRKRPK